MSQETIRAAERATGQVATMSTYDPDSDQLHEECGVFGVWAPDRDVARLTYFGLRALQHRGQESAGIAVGDGGTVMVRKDLGLLDRVFSNADLSTLSGQLAVGHVRYGTAGAKSWEASQPHLSTINSVIIALAHNGTLVNTDELRRQLIELGVPFLSNSDSEVATKLIGYFTQRTGHLREGIRKTMELVRGGYAMTLINEQALYAFRDPHGIRPLVLGRLVDEGLDQADAASVSQLPSQDGASTVDSAVHVTRAGGWVVASETCALDIVGAEYVRDVRPGEILRISAEGLGFVPYTRPTGTDTDEPLKIGVLISGSGTNLQALIDLIAAGKLSASIELVVSSRPSAKGLQRAERAGIQTLTLSKDVYADPIAADEIIAHELLERGCEYVVMAGYMRMVHTPLLAAFPNRVVNLHPALLPSFTGAHAIDDAFARGVKVTGVTVHFANEIYDNGPIIAQRALAVEEGWDVDTLEEHIHAIEHVLYPEVVQMLADGRVHVLESGKVAIDAPRG